MKNSAQGWLLWRKHNDVVSMTYAGLRPLGALNRTLMPDAMAHAGHVGQKSLPNIPPSPDPPNTPTSITLSLSSSMRRTQHKWHFEMPCVMVRPLSGSSWWPLADTVASGDGHSDIPPAGYAGIEGMLFRSPMVDVMLWQEGSGEMQSVVHLPIHPTP